MYLINFILLNIKLCVCRSIIRRLSDSFYWREKDPHWGFIYESDKINIINSAFGKQLLAELLNTTTEERWILIGDLQMWQIKLILLNNNNFSFCGSILFSAVEQLLKESVNTNTGERLILIGDSNTCKIKLILFFLWITCKRKSLTTKEIDHRWRFINIADKFNLIKYQ